MILSEHPFHGPVSPESLPLRTVLPELCLHSRFGLLIPLPEAVLSRTLGAFSRHIPGLLFWIPSGHTQATCPPLIWVTSLISASPHVAARSISCSDTSLLTATHSASVSFSILLFNGLTHTLGIHYSLRAVASLVHETGDL